MRMANSTARSLTTGSEPGSPRHTGQMLVLGASPNMFRQPQNNLVAVDSSQCTSSPTTISQRVSTTVTGARPSAAAREGERCHIGSLAHARSLEAPLERRRGPEHQWLGEGGRQDLYTDGQAVVTRSVRHGDGGVAGEVRRDGEDVGQVHGERVLGLGTQLERRRGRGGAQQKVVFGIR